MPVLLESRPLCRTTSGGCVRYQPEDMDSETMERALKKATDTVAMVGEYVRLMESAPVLRAEGLNKRYKLLTEFQRL